MFEFLKKLFRQSGNRESLGRGEGGFVESKENFEKLVASVRDYAIFLLDRNGNILTWNTGAEHIKGYRAQEIVGKHFSIFYPNDSIAIDWPAHELRVATETGRFEDESWRVRKDGSRFWANVVINALRDPSGEVRGFLKITRDLTERKQAEENDRKLLHEEIVRKSVEESVREIQSQREQLRVTLSSIGDAVIVADNKCAITFMNPVAVALTGWEATEADGQPLETVFRIINENTRAPVENPAHRVLREGVVVGLANHTILIARNGREIPIDDSGAPIRGQDGTIVGVVLVFRDVTATRRAIEDRLYLASIVESSDDAIIGLTLDGTIASWNRGARRLYGYTSQEIIGNALSILAPHDHPVEVPAMLQRIKKDESIEHFETQGLRKDGTRVEVSLTVSPVKNAAGKVIGASKIARDITARKEEDRRKTEFIALLAHELRNPLAPLRNALQIIQMAGDDRATIAESSAMMERQLQHLVRLVDDLLDVNRISRGKLYLRKEVISVEEIVKNAMEVCDGAIKHHQHQISVALPDKPVFVNADKTRMAQTVCNLLSNAIKFSTPGTEVRLDVRQVGEEAVISVKDFGIGIPPSMLPKVFDLFMQGERSLEKAQGGLGVGLTIVKRLVEMHEGSVEARSEGQGMGSEFIIRVPAVPSPSEQQKDENGELRAQPTNHRILVADDNKDAAISLAKLLRMMGNETAIAHDGIEAIETGAIFRPDVILLDIGMPKLNGYDTCRQIRELPWGKDASILALTGWGQDEDKRRSEKAGFNGHLVKPIEPAALRDLLAEVGSKTK